VIANINGTSIYLDRINYPEKITIKEFEILRIHFYDGTHQDIYYGQDQEKRDANYEQVLKHFIYWEYN